MKYLITGAGGQLGQEWIHYLQENNLSYAGFSSKELDITNVSSIKSRLDKEQPDVVINCAAYTKVDDAEDHVDLAYSINGTGVGYLAEYCAQNEIRLIHYSTDYVFTGTKEDFELYPKGFSETHPTQPVNIYGASKLAGEKAIIDSGCDYLIFRVSWLCGKYTEQNFVKTMLRLGEKLGALSVVNDQYGAPTFARNVVENSIILSQNGESGLFNISSKGTCTWYDFAKEIFKVANMDVKLKAVGSHEFPAKAKRPFYSKLSTEKISTLDGVRLINWEDGLKQMLE